MIELARGPQQLWRVTYKISYNNGSSSWRKKYYADESDMLYTLQQEQDNPTLHVERTDCDWTILRPKALLLLNELKAS